MIVEAMPGEVCRVRMIKIDDSGDKHADSTVLFIVLCHCGNFTCGNGYKPLMKCQ